MTKTRNIAKTLFVVLAMVFASSATTAANAEGRVNFSFSVNFNGNNQGHNQNFNKFVNHVFSNGGQQNQQGHYHRDRYGRPYFVAGPHRHNEKFNKHKKKVKKHAKLSSKKRLVRHLRNLGYRHIRRINKNGRYYTARAISPRGHKVWVKVDRRNGRIKGQRILAWRGN